MGSLGVLLLLTKTCIGYILIRFVSLTTIVYPIILSYTYSQITVCCITIYCCGRYKRSAKQLTPGNLLYFTILAIAWCGWSLA